MGPRRKGTGPVLFDGGQLIALILALILLFCLWRAAVDSSE